MYVTDGGVQDLASEHFEASKRSVGRYGPHRPHELYTCIMA